MQSLDLLFFYQCIHMHMGYIYIYICLAQSVDGCVRVVDLIQHLPNEIFIFRVTNVSETGHHTYGNSKSIPNSIRDGVTECVGVLPLRLTSMK